MDNENAKRLVIDTNVARNAGGEESVYPDSKNCRDFLLEVSSATSHQVLFNSEMKEEWNKHQSSFSRKWRVKMVETRRLIEIADEYQESLQAKTYIKNLPENYEGRNAMMKDCFLLDLAIMHDKIVISCDERARNLFRKISTEIPKIKEVNWINPVKIEETPIEWLKQGANLDYERSLGYIAEDE
jgi:hypothetical protein